MFKIMADVTGKPLPKDRQLEILIDLLAAVQCDAAEVTGALFHQGDITIYSKVKTGGQQECEPSTSTR